MLEVCDKLGFTEEAEVYRNLLDFCDKSGVKAKPKPANQQKQVSSTNVRGAGAAANRSAAASNKSAAASVPAQRGRVNNQSKANAPAARSRVQATSQARPTKTNILTSAMRPNNVTNSIKKPVLNPKAKTDEAVAVSSLVSAYKMLEEVKTADTSDDADGSSTGQLDQAAFFSALAEAASVLNASNAESIANAMASKLNLPGPAVAGLAEASKPGSNQAFRNTAQNVLSPKTTKPTPAKTVAPKNFNFGGLK